jgi:hypothetical protein
MLSVCINLAIDRTNIRFVVCVTYDLLAHTWVVTGTTRFIFTVSEVFVEVVFLAIYLGGIHREKVVLRERLRRKAYALCGRFLNRSRWDAMNDT